MTQKLNYNYTQIARISIFKQHINLCQLEKLAENNTTSYIL